MTRYYNNISHDDLVRANRALLKFCREHGYPEGGLSSIQQCLEALEQDDFREAVRHFNAVPLGGMGCFGDWLPPAAFEHENRDYVCTVFKALTERWYRLMSTAMRK